MFAGKSHLWMKVNDFLVEVGAERTVQDFKTIILKQIGDLIPYDVAAAWLEMGRTCPVKMCDNLEVPEKWVAAHNDYYYKVAPAYADLNIRKMIFSDYKLFQDTEYYQDFLRPLGVRYGAGKILHVLRGNPSLTLHLRAGFLGGSGLAGVFHEDRRAMAFYNEQFAKRLDNIPYP